MPRGHRSRTRTGLRIRPLFETAGRKDRVQTYSLPSKQPHKNTAHQLIYTLTITLLEQAHTATSCSCELCTSVTESVGALETASVDKEGSATALVSGRIPSILFDGGRCCVVSATPEVVDPEADGMNAHDIRMESAPNSSA